MDGNVERILGEENIKDAIDEICDDVKDFSKVEFIHILWGKQGNDKNAIDVKARFFGEGNTLIAELEKAKFVFLQEALCYQDDD